MTEVRGRSGGGGASSCSVCKRTGGAQLQYAPVILGSRCLEPPASTGRPQAIPRHMQADSMVPYKAKKSRTQ